MKDANTQSKLTKKQTFIQVVKFIAFSLGAGIIQIVSYTLIHELSGWAHWKCYLPSLILSVLYNFTVNRRYTFKSANNVPVAMLKVGLFYCVFTPVSAYLGNLAEKAGVNNYIVELLTMLANLILEYLVCRFWVYRTSMNTNKLGQKEQSKEKDSKENIE